MKKMLLGLSMIFMGMSAVAADCIPKTEMAEIATHFTQFSKYSKAEFCYDGSQTSHLLASLMFMKKTAFANTMKKSPDDLFSGRFANDWYGYFIERISDITVQANCPKGVGAFVYGFGSTMYVCPMMLTDSFSALDRASVFMHEARHIDGFPHTTCPEGARKDLDGACDDRISSGGSYAVTVETYSQLAKYAVDLNPALRAYSMASAVTYADEAFEVPVQINRTEQLLVMTKNQNLFSLDPQQNNAVTALGKAPTLGKIIPRAQHLILFPSDRTLPARYLFQKNEGEISQAAGEAIVEYNGQTPQQRSNLVELHLGAQWVAKIYQDRIRFTCDPRSAAVSELSFNGDTPVSIVYPNGYKRSDRLQTVVMASGKLMDFGCTENGFKPFLKASSMKLDQNYKRIYRVGPSIVGLTEQGLLFNLTAGRSTAIQTSQDGQIFEIAPRQSYQFLDSVL